VGVQAVVRVDERHDAGREVIVGMEVARA